MDSTSLLDAYRVESGDVAQPYLWDDEELFRYMDQAYKQFVRLTGGISDISSAATTIPVVTGENLVQLHPSIMNIRRCSLASDGSIVEVVNIQDLDEGSYVSSDYGVMLQALSSRTQGRVRYLIVGQEDGVGQLVNIPVEDDELRLVIYRLPLRDITTEGQPLSEVKALHHPYLIHYMKYLAHLKQDTEIFNPKVSETHLGIFERYCAQVKAEWERYKHKPRTTAYGGI